ncbi:M20 aminoacylase family protein [Taklimakanibacter lacteus]|uniref:M20 aminoacylase family protein n=1 Tax=Taklimakanibacter lacteus TaxID=2268456 RepID=UPI000E66ACD1
MTKLSANDRVASYDPELRAIRHDLHRNPELAFEETRTSEIVARELARLGYQVKRNVAGTGVVGTLQQGMGRKAIGLRADMDALPISEATGLSYQSLTPGKMHACGHDGHTTTLLGAARYLAESRNFDGTVHLIFQPAEENIGGAQRMIAEGLFRRFPCDAVFAFHNWPGMPAGQFAGRSGTIMAAVDMAKAVISGPGGHGAVPHETVDPVVAGAAVVTALQTIVARNIDPVEAAVVTVGAFNAGTACNVIPESAALEISVRSCSSRVRQQLAERVPAIIRGVAEAHGCAATVDYELGYPATVNTAEEAAFARAVAAELKGPHPIIDLPAPTMISEDFAYMLEAVPGCYFMLGNGAAEPRRMLHTPGYDFNDELLVIGASLWGRMVERFLPKV